MIIHGRNLIVSIGGVAMFAARSCEIDVQADALEKSSASQGKWREYDAGRKGWSVNVGHLLDGRAIADEEQIQSPLWYGMDMVGKKVALSWAERGAELNRVNGQAIVKEWRVTGAVGNLCQGTFAFLGTGPITGV